MTGPVEFKKYTTSLEYSPSSSCWIGYVIKDDQQRVFVGASIDVESLEKATDACNRWLSLGEDEEAIVKMIQKEFKLLSREPSSLRNIKDPLVRDVLIFQETNDDAAFASALKQIKPYVLNNARVFRSAIQDDAQSVLMLAVWRALKQVDIKPADNGDRVLRLVGSILRRAKLHMLRGFSHYRGVDGELDTTFRDEFPGHKLSIVPDADENDAGNCIDERSLKDDRDPYDRIMSQENLKGVARSASTFDRDVLELLASGYDSTEITKILDCSYFLVRRAKARLAANTELRTALNVTD